MRFRLGQRVVLERPEYAELQGRTAIVVRLLKRSTEEAWVNVEGTLIPITCRSFPANDERHNHVCIFDDECTEINP